MKTNKLILLGLICLTVAMPTTAQNRNEKKERTERAVKEAIAAKQYKINVDRMQPMRSFCLPRKRGKKTTLKV